MKYSELVGMYDALGATTKRLEKAQILAEFFRKNLDRKEDCSWVYLLLGRVYPENDTRETGISRQLAIKAISESFSVDEAAVAGKFAKIGDLGEVAESLAVKRKQGALFSKALKTSDVMESIKKLSELEGKGTVGKKISIISSLYSNASAREALYITRTLLGDLRIGIAIALVLDALNIVLFDGEKEARKMIEEKYLLSNDLVRISTVKNIDELRKIDLAVGKPTQVMLAVKVSDIDEAFDACGKPAAFEHKYDGFRVVVHKAAGKIALFTRKLENVTAQFPDVVECVKQNVDGDSFILDSEVVGFDRKTKRYMPFEAISQRIRRKYDIHELVEKLPVEVNIFDVLYLDGENKMELPFAERRKIVERIVRKKEWVIRPAMQIVTGNEEEAQKFYENALKIGEEGVMIKDITKPYRFGRYVGYMAKLKPLLTELDLVITAAEHGTGKRAGWLTSFIVACRDGDDFVEVGRVSSGLKEKEEEGFSYNEMTKLLNELKIDEKDGIVQVEPRVVVSVNYQNIQPSEEYSSGYALRFPRILAYRPDRNTSDIAALSDIKKAFSKGQRK